MKLRALQFNVVFRPEPEGGFTVVVPSLPGCVTYGKDLREARRMATDAIRGYLSVLKEQKQKIQSDEGSFVGHISLAERAHA